MDQDFYTPTQAARILGVTDRHVRQHVAGGELEGEQTDTGRRKIPQREVHRVLEERRQRSPEESPGDAQEAAELRARVEDLQRHLGRLEGRLELTELTESTMQAERDRLIADLDWERERADRLEAELRESRRSWWQRLFGRSRG